MSEKPESKRRRREFNIESDRNALPLLRIFATAGFVAGLLMLGAGLTWNLHAFVTGSPLILIGSGIMLWVARKGREQVKEYDAKKDLNPPTE